MAIFKAGVAPFPRPIILGPSSRCLNSGVYAIFVGCNAPTKLTAGFYPRHHLSRHKLGIPSAPRIDLTTIPESVFFWIRRNSLGPTFLFFLHRSCWKSFGSFFLVVVVCYNVCTFCGSLQIYLQKIIYVYINCKYVLFVYLVVICCIY